MEDHDKGSDIYHLFTHYNSLYFDGALSFCTLNTSSKLTNCTGTCHYDSDGSCQILLAEHLLKLCSTASLKNILLHEMIHAFLSIKHKRDHSEHCSSFQELRNTISSSSMKDCERPNVGYNISLHHEFKEEVGANQLKKEVNAYQFYHWKCDTCGDSMKKTRKPSARDCIGKVGPDQSCGNSSCRWHNHRNACPGTYTIAEPHGYKVNEMSMEVEAELQHDKLELPGNCIARDATEKPPESETTDRKLDENMDSKGDQELEEDNMLLPRMTRQSIKGLCNTLGAQEKSNCKKAITTKNYFQAVNDAKRNLGKNVSSDDGSQRKSPEALNVSNIPIQKPFTTRRSQRVNKKPAPKRRQESIGNKRETAWRWTNKLTPVPGCLCVYGDEEDDENVPPLKNKRTVRRKRLKELHKEWKMMKILNNI